jgi:phosphatidate cytidylyltransferase
MLSVRIATALVGIPLFLVAILAPGGWLLAIALSLLAGVGLWEFARACRTFATTPRIVPNPGLLIWGALMPLLTRAYGDFALELSLLLALGIGFLWELAQAWRHSTRAVAYNIGLGLFAALYVGWLMAFGVRLRADFEPVMLTGWQVEQGALKLLWLMAMLWLGDSMAYFVGRWLGRHRLAPLLSPSKSWEGALANFVCCLLIGLAGGGGLGLPLWKAGLIGAGVGILGQLGDLFESSLKRAIGLKDFGGILPGHGGILDRFDSFLFSVPWVWWWLAR